MKYKRGEILYECEQSKYRQQVEIRFLVKWAQAGDFICQPLNDNYEPCGDKFIEQPKAFYKNFEKVEDDRS